VQSVVASAVGGETIGETGLIANEPRNARIIAIRDSEMLFLSRDGFEHFSRLHPESMLRLARIALRRSYVSAAPETLTCVPRPPWFGQ